MNNNNRYNRPGGQSRNGNAPNGNAQNGHTRSVHTQNGRVSRAAPNRNAVRSAQPVKRSPHKKRGIPAWKVVLAVVALLVIIIIGLSASFLKFYKPAVDTDVPFDTKGGGETSVTAPSTGDGEDTQVSVDTDSGMDGYVRDTDVVNFLVVGRDVEGWNTDVIMIVNFNMKKGSLAIIQMPRDTYVEIDSVHGRINTALSKLYSAERKKSPDKDTDTLIKAGMDGFCRLIEKTLCIKIDGYAYMNLQGFRGIVDAMGGVYMDVPYQMDYDDPDQNLSIHLKPGPQTLTGTQAEGFVRFRSGYVQADIGRIDAQKMFLTAFFKQVKSSMNVSTISKLVEQIAKYVLTDVPIQDIIIYAKELLGVDMGNISMMTLRGAALQNERGAWYYVMNRASMLTMVNKYFNVYSKPITDEIFDPTIAFTDEDDSYFSEIYYASPDDSIVTVKPDVQTGEEIDDGDLSILLH